MALQMRVFLRRRIWGVALAVAVAMALGAAPASAEFGPPVTLSPAGFDAEFPYVAMDDTGDAVVVWRSNDHTLTDQFRIQLRARSAGGILGPVQTLAGAGDHSHAHIAIDAEGNALAVWRTTAGGTFVRARPRSAAGVLGPLQTVSSNGWAPHVAMDPDGDALVAWQRSSNGPVQARARSAAGALGPTQNFSSLGVFGGWIYPDDAPKVAMDADGDALVVWQGANAASGRIQARRRTAAGALGPVRTLSEGEGSAQLPTVAMDAAGNALVAWAHIDDSGFYYRVQARPYFAATNTFGAVRNLSEPVVMNGITPRVAMNAGKAQVVWSEGSQFYPRARTYFFASDTLGPTQNIANMLGDVNVAVDGDGNAVIAWTSSARVFARTRSAAGVLGPIKPLSHPSVDPYLRPQIAMSPAGHALVVWQIADGPHSRVQAAAGP